MKFSTKSRYALRLMAELARYAPGTTVSLKEISERQNLSLKYLEQIVTPLAGDGIVDVMQREAVPGNAEKGGNGLPAQLSGDVGGGPREESLPTVQAFPAGGG